VCPPIGESVLAVSHEDSTPLEAISADDRQ
jgi:hypothetical protein